MSAAENPQAFPCLDETCGSLALREPGMTLRDYFAGQALAGMLARDSMYYKDAAKFSYHFADAMLAERNK